jgi:hypothetical protein
MSSIKLGSLLVRTLSKPLANSLKRNAKNNQKFERFCIGIAKAFNRFDLRFKMRFQESEVEPIRPLTDQKAVELGANFLAEAIIFSVGAITIIFEALRTKERRSEMNNDIMDLESQLNEQRQDIERLELSVSELQTLLLHIQTDPSSSK